MRSAHAQILDSVYTYTYSIETKAWYIDVLRGLCGTGILIAFIDPTDGSWADDLMASDNKWRPMIDAVLYSNYTAWIVQNNYSEVCVHTL